MGTLKEGPENKKSALLALAAILIYAAATRLNGIMDGMPYVYNTDEAILVDHALAFGTGTLKPASFIYPSFFMYVLFVVYGLMFLGGWVFGFFHSTADFIKLFFHDAAPFYVSGRLLVLISGVAAVAMAYVIGKKLYGVFAGLAAALFLSVCVLHVDYSNILKLHVPAGMFVAFCIYFCVLILQNGAGELKHYIYAGLFAGLAGSTVYHAGLVAVSIPVVFIIKRLEGKAGTAVRPPAYMFAAAVVASIAGFLIGTPYALIDSRTFLRELASAGSLYSGGGIWEHGLFYPFESIVLSYGRPLGYLMLLSLGGFIFSKRHRKTGILLASYPLFLALFLMMFKIKEVQHMLVSFVPLSILGAGLLADMLSATISNKKIKLAVSTLVVCALSANSGAASVQKSVYKTLPDTRTLAKEWMEKNVPRNSVISVDSGKYYISTFSPPLKSNEKSLNLMIERESNFDGTDLSLRDGTRRKGYTGAAKYFKMQLQSIDQNDVTYEIIRVIFPGLSSNFTTPVYSELVANGTQYFITSSYATFRYGYNGDLQRGRPEVAEKYRKYYRDVAEKAVLIKRFQPSSDSKGPEINIYKAM